MSLSYNGTEIKLIISIFLKCQSKSTKSSYLYRLAKDVGRSLPTTLENLEKLVQKGLVACEETGIPRGKRGPVRIYTLTNDGVLFAQVLRSQIKKQNVV
jgi:DNA-binding PadR family transcriptional regulator